MIINKYYYQLYQYLLVQLVFFSHYIQQDNLKTLEIFQQIYQCYSHQILSYSVQQLILYLFIDQQRIKSLSLIHHQLTRLVWHRLLSMIQVNTQQKYYLGIFEQLQFNGYIKKQNFMGNNLPQKYKNPRDDLFHIYKVARQPSLLAFLVYIGIINLPYFKSYPIYQQLFDKFSFNKQQIHIENQTQSNNNNNNNNNNKIQITNGNKSIKIHWKQHIRYEMSQKLIQSIIINDLAIISNELDNQVIRSYFMVTYGQYTNFQSFNQLQSIITGNRPQYQRCINRFYNKGKIIKYLCIKNRFTQTQSSQNRHQLQMNLTFSGILVYDQWPNKQNIQILKKLNQIKNCLNLIFISIKTKQALSGYDVILNHSKIYYNQGEHIRTKLIYENIKQHNTVILTGRSIIDQEALGLADISIKVNNNSPSSADYQITSSQQIIQLLKQGRWNLDTVTISFICLILFILGRIITQIFIFVSKSSDTLLNLSIIPQKPDHILLIYYGTMIIPLLLLNIYDRTYQIRTKYYKNFFRIDLSVNLLMLIIGSIALFGIQFMDHKFQDNCQQANFNINLNINKQVHFIKLRRINHYQQIVQTVSQNWPQLDNTINSPCQQLLIYLNVSYNFLVILLLDTSTQSRSPKSFIFSHINKFYMLILWIFSIFYFTIPKINIFRSIIIIFIVFIMLKIFQWIKSINNHQKQANQINQNLQKDQQNSQRININEDSQDNQQQDQL